MRKYKLGHFGVLLFLALIATVGWADRTQLKPGTNVYSKDDEIKLGLQADAQVQQKMEVVRDPALTNYIQQLGAKLARYAPGAQGYRYKFGVIRDKSINAFALPGGPVYVNTGTIAACQNEDQLAGVMAHEITHVALRHATSEATKSGIWGALLGIGGAAVGAPGLANLGTSIISMKYSRGAETQADIGGAQIMYDAGYNPEELARFFQTLEREGGSRSVQWLSDHPNPGNRVGTIQKEERLMGAVSRPAKDTPPFEQARQLAQSLGNQPGRMPGSGVSSGQAGSDRQQPRGSGYPGYPDDAANQGNYPQGGMRQPPSRQLRTFDGGSFRIGYPSNWTVYNQEGSSLMIAPPEGRVEGGLAYGAMISNFEPQRADVRRDPAGAVSELVDQLRQGNPSLRVTGGNQRVNVRGRAGTSTTMTNRSPAGGNEIDWLVTVPQADGTLWYAIFVAPERDYPNLRASFQQMLDSVQFR